MKQNIAILASGNGTNAENFMNFFENSEIAQISLILSDKKSAFVLERAKNHHIPSFSFTKSEFFNAYESINTLPEYKVLSIIEKYDIDIIILAGFLLKVPDYILKRFPGKIFNIHPALLPNYGGKGMYGMRVHKAVISAKEKESGITIHLIDENYDQGSIIYQAKCHINEQDTPETLASKIHELEKQYPVVINNYLVKHSIL